MDLIYFEEGSVRKYNDFVVYHDDEFLKLTIRKNTQIDLTALKELYRMIGKGGISKPTAIMLQAEMTINHEAREYFNKLSKRFPSPPIAVITERFNERLIANFYKNFYRPETPYQIFKEETEAMDWLKTQEK